MIIRRSIQPLLFSVLILSLSVCQDRIEYNNQQLFLNGANIAWVNFASDIGPGYTNFSAFEQMFQDVHDSGGNSMRFWMHTNGAISPAFDVSGYVTGPGAGTLSDLEQILDLAWENEIGLMLCLWSFDMLRISFGSTITDRNYDMLTNTAYLDAYIDNSLIPMVEAVGGHPGILSWEIFNEPEGMSNEHGWDFNHHVPMSNIQRFINKCTGAIHRTDPDALVTNGSWAFIASTDVGGNYNYYTDERLIAAGGDQDGTLDFYTVHYYDWAGTSLSPFHHPVSYWQLDKPLAIAEFWMEDTYNVDWEDLYETLYSGGYAGALGWQWFDGEPHRTRMMQVMDQMFTDHQQDVDVVAGSGYIISFTAYPEILEPGESSELTWMTSPGSQVTLNGASVPESGSQSVSPSETTVYTLETQGDFSDTRSVEILVLQPGVITAFQAEPPVIVQGETSLLSWTSVEGSMVQLDGVPVASSGSEIVMPSLTTTYQLTATGAVEDSREVTVEVVPFSEINRALNRPVYVSSSETGFGNENPANAVDGDPVTRWSSDWSEPEWIYVDLGQVYTITRVVLEWEVAFGLEYEIQVSETSLDWTSIYHTAGSNGETDDITGLEGNGRFVRMYGIQRATEWGFSLWEFEVYAAPYAGNQPPDVVLVSPLDGQSFDENETISLEALAVDDVEIVQVIFLTNGSILNSDDTYPYGYDWLDPPTGIFEIVAEAIDNEGAVMYSQPVTITVGNPYSIFRFEAEEAALSNEMNIEMDPNASNQYYVYMPETGQITWTLENIPEAGVYTLTIGYRLLVGYNNQFLLVNGENIGAVEFSGPFMIWITRNISVELNEGLNTVSLVADTGMMHFDYIQLLLAFGGCMDESALNFYPIATWDDGSCEYELMPGDVDANGQVNVSDIVIIVGIILDTIEPADWQLIAGDVTGDGAIDVLDVVAVVDMILNG